MRNPATQMRPDSRKNRALSLVHPGIKFLSKVFIPFHLTE